jgi:hypothetical protein
MAMSLRAETADYVVPILIPGRTDLCLVRESCFTCFPAYECMMCLGAWERFGDTGLMLRSPFDRQQKHHIFNMTTNYLLLQDRHQGPFGYRHDELPGVLRPPSDARQLLAVEGQPRGS